MQQTQAIPVGSFIPGTRPIARSPNPSEQSIEEAQSESLTVRLRSRIMNLFDHNHMKLKLSYYEYYKITTRHREELDKLGKLENNPKY